MLLIYKEIWGSQMERINNQMLGVTGLSLCVQMEQQNLSTAVAVSFSISQLKRVQHTTS